MAMAFLSQFFDYIPSTALAAIIITAVVFMIEVKIIIKIWRIDCEYYSDRRKLIANSRKDIHNKGEI